MYISNYLSPLGKIILASDDSLLIGLWFYGQKYFKLDKNFIEKETSVIKTAKNWLDIYFSGKNPSFMPEISLNGTEFQIQVWKILEKIPYGKTVTYNEIAKEIAKQKGVQKMSAQAVGSAVGHNKISIIIPCHRVIGSNGSLTGYAGGIDKKIKLLELEGCNINPS